MLDNIFEICNIKYKELKRKKIPEKLAYTAPELLPNIESDQIKVVIEVFQNLLNDIIKENLDLKHEIENIKYELDKKQNKNTNCGFGPY